MSRYRQKSISRINTLFARVTAFLLLVGIVYSATFGAVHAHKSVSFNSAANLSIGETAHMAVSETPFRSTTDTKECLVCALHRDFSSSTVHSPALTVGPSNEIAYVSAPAVFYSSDLTYSRLLTRSSGRAPPLRLV